MSIPKPSAKAAERIINRFMGDETGKGNALKVKVKLELDTDNGKDRFCYTLQGRKLTINASSPVAACRGFYDFVKANEAGICSWSGNRFEIPSGWTKTSQAEFTSPYRDHQYFNVVTYGYTTPYWDEERWDQEIDWMALHGIDMPLMLVGAEMVYREVFREMGLTDGEIDEWEVGPAHLPWFRMGNLAGNSFDGPLGDNWNRRQRELATHILQRMRELGMKPVCPAFGGFVPRALRNKVEGVETVGWNWCKNDTYGNYRLSPGSAAFRQIGTRFIQRWEEVFGECKYYLSDSFNEMAVPNDLDLLTQYGDNIFECIRNGSSNPEAVWVTQGWTFVYQSGEWGRDKFNALTKNIDKDRFIMLYMSPEYGNGKWNSPYEGFNGMEWNVTMLPNMGGKNFYNGGLTDYTGPYRTQYKGANVSNLIGWGLTPEGVENNEMLYELICDAGWTPASTNMNVEAWMDQYAQNRYGNEGYTREVRDFLNVLRNTVYQSYQDHKCFGWQGYNKTSGYINSSIDPGNTFFAGVESLFCQDNTQKLHDACKSNVLLRADLIEAAVFYAGCKVEKLNKRIGAANSQGKKAEARRLVETLRDVMLRMDRALTAHPTYDEQKWEDKAARMGTSDSDKAKYVRNARRIVSVWYGDHGKAANSHEPVNDYACRIWAGLIRDYYMPRLVAEWENIIDNKGNNLRTLENAFVDAPSLSAVQSMESVSDAEMVDFLIQLVADSKEAGVFQIQKITDIKMSTDSESHWYAFRNAEPDFFTRVITASGTNLSSTNKGTLTANDFTGSVSQYWRIMDNGDGTCRLENRSGQNMAYDPETGKTVTCLTNLDTDMKLVLTSDPSKLDANRVTENSWGILPGSIESNGNTGLHINGGQGLMVWNFTVGNQYYPATCWTIEEADKLDETYAEDYDRYRRRLQGFTKSVYGDVSLYGRLGQPKSTKALETAIAKLGNYTAGDHETYDEFLRKWDAIWSESIVVPGKDVSAGKQKLFSLIVNTFQLTPSNASKEANTLLASALREAQRALATPDVTDAAIETATVNLQKVVRDFLAR